MAYGRKLSHERGKQDGRHKSATGRRHMGSAVLRRIMHRGGKRR